MSAEALYLREDLAGLVGNEDPFAYFGKLEGEVFRKLEFRQTFCTTLNGKNYFVKFHRGSSVGEILKNLFQFRLPVISARNEWRALRRLNELGIAVPAVAAFGVRGKIPMTCVSFIVTDDVGTQENLEDLTRHWPEQPPVFSEKLALLKEVALTSARMHNHGICHRDFYLCHFLISGQGDKRLTLLDLHRALVKPVLGQRWRIKDIGGLYFSAMDIGLSQRDLLRFMRWYSGKKLKTIFSEDAAFWKRVRQRAFKLKNK